MFIAQVLGAVVGWLLGVGLGKILAGAVGIVLLAEVVDIWRNGWYIGD